MRIVGPADWSVLSSYGRVRYRVSAGGRICLQQAPNSSEPPFDVSARFEWIKGGNPDDWVLRTSGPPVTMQRIAASFGDLAAAAADRHDLDPRLVLTAIACESRGDPTHPSGRDVRSPRTEIGYPDRQGEQDPGDPARDAIDWANYQAKGGGTHSSHGLMQTLISTAVAAAPRFFRNIAPEQYRSILWDPAVSIECGAAFFGGFPPDDRNDPVRARFRYGAGRVYPDTRNKWGARMYIGPDGKPAEGPVILNWIAFWNDLTSAGIGESCAPQPGGAV